MGDITMIQFLLFIVALLAAPLANAGESGSQVAWDQATLDTLKKGNAEHGGNLAQTCKACHGERGEGSKATVEDGETIPAVPAIAGQLATYTYKQLRDYANGDRSDASMTGIAKSLSEQDAADLATWFSSLPLPRIEGGDKDSGKLNEAEKMAKEGDGKRILPPCFVCHGSSGQGEKIDIPGLAGQQGDYLEKTLLAYKNGERHNDIYSRMRLIAKQLSAEEIKQLSIYYQQLR
jgi:cytochrome c553